MSDESFSEAMEGLFRALRRAKSRWAHAIEEGGLSPAQFILVVPLLDGRPRSVRELAEAAVVAPPTATRTLDGLERDGLVVRRHSESDRRCVLVELTGAGRTALKAARTASRARRRVLYEALDPGEREEAERVLRRLAEVVQDS